MGYIYVMTTDQPPPRPDQAAIGAALYGLMSMAVRSGPREISLTATATLGTLQRTGPRRLTDLAMVEGVTQPSMTVLVTNLERAGLVARQPGPDDRRVVLVTLTEAGKEYLRARREAGAATFASLIGKLTPDEVAALSAAVPALNHLRDLDGERRAASPGPAAGRADRTNGANS
jgi:DNA-binding MarR family transcriptional regulator